jgi:ribonuclease HI
MEQKARRKKAKQHFAKKTTPIPTKKPRNLKNLSEVTIYTDGACSYNPGPGGYGVVLIYKNTIKELSGGFRLTTNNRMEIMACIEGLRSLKEPCAVTLFSDSKYVVDAMKKGWAKKWKANDWKRNENEFALNIDLWKQMLDLCQIHNVAFNWVKGHAGNEYNERCDQLATQALSQPELLSDTAYEESKNNYRTFLKCPECGAPMVLRTGKYGKFYGCSRFPKCNAVQPATRD